MSEAASGDQRQPGQTEQTGQPGQADMTGRMEAEVDTLEIVFPDDSPANVGANAGETAREVAANHLSRLMYAPVNTWSTYVFHENDPHPFSGSRQRQGRG